ncbi:MAG TPA: FlgD immunoglobulin-like domain containing protein [Candidatus Kapabacteria bacterium]|nr:FlgD immunoglobulin-like domain containing protein [Candidatus Kapabacteria bacterium]
MKNKVRLFLAILIIIPIFFSFSYSQNTKLKKQVIGSGGMLHEKSDGISVSGMLGQTVIEKKTPTSPIDGINYDLFQGFWVPDPYYTVGVNDHPISYNNNLKNYPNPFNNQTTISYELKAPANVSIKVYDMVGNVVSQVFSGYQNAGPQQVIFESKDNHGTQMASGSYVYEVSVNPIDMAGNQAFEPYILRSVMIIVK